MRINGSIFDPLRPDRAATPTSDPGAQRPQDTRAPGATPARSDSVQLSDAGRALAGRLKAEDGTTLDPERIAELRARVFNGAYSSLDIVDQVARRILTRGDL